MRIARMTQPSEMGTAYYHALSNTVFGTAAFTAEDKDMFVKAMRRYEEFCKVKVVTYAFMDDHFHLLLEVPPPPKKPLTDSVLLEHAKKGLSPMHFQLWHKAFLAAKKAKDTELLAKLRGKISSRFSNLSEFFSIFNQVCSTNYCRAHSRRGQIWDGRVKTTLVENSPIAVATVAAWIDLNPVRSKVATISARYPWCGYAKAVAGDPQALEGLSIVALKLGAESNLPSHTFAAYEPWLEIENKGSGFSGEGRIGPKADPAELNRGRLLRRRVRYFADGAAMGSKDYVATIIDLYRGRHPVKKGRPHKMIGDWDELHVMRGLRETAFDFRPFEAWRDPSQKAKPVPPKKSNKR